MPNCAIISCRKSSRTSNIVQGGISFHRFPKAPDLREKWIDVTGRDNWMPSKFSTICSIHFRENDFVIKKSGYRYLKPEAIPRERIVQVYTSSLDINPCREFSMVKRSDDAIAAKSKQDDIDNQDYQMLSSNTLTPRQRKLQNIIINKESIIKKQRIKIKRIQAQNRILKKKIIKIEEVLKDLLEKLSLQNEGARFDQTDDFQKC